MKIGGENFKMSAEDFQTKLIAAKEVAKDEGLEISDKRLVMMILLVGDIIDKNQYQIVSLIKERLWESFVDGILSNKKLEKKFGGIDQLYDIVPEEIEQASLDVLKIFDDFCERAIKAFTDDSVKNKLFDIYDKVVDDPKTKEYFKENAGVKHSQIYDQPGAGRRAKDVSNLVGNLRHISRFMLDEVKRLKRTGSTLVADRLERDAKQLVDPDAISSTLKLFIKSKPPSPLFLKALEAAAREIMNQNFETLTAPSPQPPAEADVAAPAVDAEISVEKEVVPTPVAEVPPTSYTTQDVTSTIDDIISDFKDIVDPAEKESFISMFSDASKKGPSADLLGIYPNLKTAKDYERLVDQLTALNESSYISLITNLIRESIRR
jgi:hypothetical protein